MKQNTFRHLCITILFLITGLLSMPSIKAQETDDDIQFAITQALAETTYDERTSVLGAILLAANESGISYADETKNAFYNALIKQFDDRLEKKYKVPAEDDDLYYLTALFKESSLITSNQATALAPRKAILDLEEPIFAFPKEIAAETSFLNQLTKLGTILSDAKNITFVSEIKPIFFKGVETIFGNRSTADKTALRTTTQINTLKSRLNDAKTTPLLTSADQTKIQEFLTRLQFEQDLTAVLSLTYGAQIDRLTTLVAGASALMADTITQNIFNNVLTTVIASRGNLRAADIITGQLSNKLFTFLNLGPLTSSMPSLLSTTQQTAITTKRGVIEIEKKIEGVPALTDFNAKLNELIAIVNLARGKTLDVITVTLFYTVLNDLFASRVGQNLVMLQKLRDVLTGQNTSTQNTTSINIASSNLITTQKDLITGTASTSMKSILDAEILALQRFDLIMAPATNTTTIPQLANSTRYLEMGKLLAENTASTTLAADLEGKIFLALERTYNTRAQNLNELNNLKTLFSNWIFTNAPTNTTPRTLLTEPHRATILTWITNVTTEIEIINLPTITDPNVIIITIGDPNKFILPLSSDLQDKIFAALQRAFNNRTQVITLLTQLIDLFQKWIDKNALRPTQNEILRGYIVTLRAEIRALEQKALVDALGPTPGIDIIITTLDPNQFTLPLSPALQDAIFSYLQRAFNNRTQVADLLERLKTLFQAWLDKNALKPTQNTQLQAWIVTLRNELFILDLTAILAQIAALPLEQQIARFNALIGQITSITPTPPAAAQNLIFAALTTLYNSRLQTITFLQSLLTLLNNYVASPLLNATPQKSTITTVWIPQINKEIAALNAAQAIAGATPETVTPTDMGRLYTDVSGGGFSLNPEDQIKIWELLLALINRRQQNLDALNELLKLLNDWLNSNKLGPDQTGGIQTWIITITRDKTLIETKDKIDDIFSKPIDPTRGLTPGITIFIDFYNNYGSKTDFTPEQLAQLFDALQKLFDGRNRNSLTELNSLLDLFTKWSTAPALSTDQKSIITSQPNGWIPTINADLLALQLKAVLVQMGTITDYTILIGSLGDFLTRNAGKPLDPDTEAAIFAQLLRAFNGRRQTTPDLTALLTLLTNWLNSNLLTPDHNNTINNVWIPAINVDLDAIAITTAIRAAMALTDYNAKLDALMTIVTTYGTKTVTTPNQNLFLTAIQQVFNGRIGKTFDLLTTLLQFVNASVATTCNLLNADQKSNVTSTLISVIQSELQAFTIEKAIRDALALTDYTAQLNALIAIEQQAATMTFSGSTQNLFATALVQVFNNRMTQTLDALKLLSSLLTTATTSPLLAAPQKAYVQDMVNTLAVEIAIKSALAFADYGDQLDALLDMIFQYSNIRVVDQRVQGLFFDVLKQVFANRVSQYTTPGLDDTNIDKLALLLLTANESSLLNTAQQAVSDSWNVIVTFEQTAFNALKLTYSGQLSNALRILRGAPGKTFDAVTYNLFFRLIESIFNNLKASTDTTTINSLKEALTLAAISPMLSFDQKQQVKSIMLPALGVTVATTPFDQSMNTILLITDPQSRINNLKTFITQNSGKTLTTDQQTALMSVLQQLIGGLDLTNATVKDLVTQLLTLMQTSTLLSSAQKTFITTTLLPSIQPESIGAAPTVGVAPPPTAAISPQAGSGFQLPPSFSAATGFVPATAETFVTLGNKPAATQIDLILSLLNNAVGQFFDPALQNTFAAILNALIAQQNKLDPASLAKLILILQSLQGSSLLSTAQSDALTGYIQTVGTTANKVLAPTAANIAAAIKIQDPIQRMQALAVLLENITSDQIFDATTQNLVATALNELSVSSKGFDPINQAKFVALLQKAQTSPVLAENQQAYLRDTIAPSVNTQATNAATPSVESINNALAQKNPGAQLDALALLVQNAAGKPLDIATQAALARVLGTIANAAGSLDPINQAKLNALMNSAGTTLQLGTDIQQQITATTARVATATGKPPKPTIDSIKLAASRTGKEQLDALTNLLNGAQGGTFDAATQDQFTTLLASVMADSQNADPATLARIQAIAAQAATSPLLNPTQQANIRGSFDTIQAAATAAKVPNRTNINRIMAQTDPQLQIQSLSTLMNSAKGQSIDSATQQATATLLAHLMSQRGSMDAATRKQLDTLVKQAKTSNLLSPTQQKAVKAGKLPAKPAAAPVPVPTANTITAASAKTGSAQLDALEKMLTGAANQTFDAATQAQFETLLASVTSGSLNADGTSNADPATLARIKAITAKAATSPLVSNAKKSELAATILPALTAAAATAIQPTLDNMNRIKAQTDPKLRIASLSALMESAKSQSLDPATQQATQQATAELIATLMSQRGTLDKATQTQLDALVKKASASTLLNSTQQKAAKAGQLPASPAPRPTISTIQSASGKTGSAQLDALEQMLNGADFQTFDAETQAAFETLLTSVTSGSMNADGTSNADPATLARIRAITAKAATSTLLSDVKKAELATSVLPILTAAASTALQPTIENVNRVRTQADPKLQIASLNALIDSNANNTTIDDATKQATAELIASLMTQRGSLDKATQAQLDAVLKKSQTSTLLSTSQQDAVKAGKQPATPKPPKPTISTINAAKTKTGAAQLNILEQMLNGADSQMFDAETQATFETLLANVTNENLSADPATLARIKAITTKAATSPLVSDAKKATLTATVLPALQEAQTTALQPTTNNINRVRAQSDPMLQIEALSALMDSAAGNTSIDPMAQQATADLVATLIAKRNTLDPATRAKLDILIKKAEKTELLSPAQQKTIKAQATAKPSAAPKPAAPKPAATPKAAAPKAAAPKPAAAKPTITSINAIAGKTGSAQLDALEQMLNAAVGQEFDVATQNKFALLLAKIADESANADPATLARIKTIATKAATSPLISQEQKDYVSRNMLPSIEVSKATALQPTANNINRVKTQTDPKLQIDALSALMDNATSNKNIDATTQQATAELIATLIAKRSTLDKATQAKLDVLITKAGKTTLLSPEQQSAVTTQATLAQAVSLVPTSGKTTPKPTSSTINTAKTKTGSAQLDALEQMLAGAVGQEFDETTKTQFAALLENITNESMNADPATLARIKTITAKAASSPLVSDTKKTELAARVLPALIAATTTALLPTTENINRVKAQSDPKLQIDALSALMSNATGNTDIDETTKQATADLIATLIAKRSTLDKTTQAKLDALITKAGTTALLSPAQQSTITMQVAQAQASVAGATPGKTTPKPTPSTINAAKTKTGSAQLDALEQMLAGAVGQEFDESTQVAFETLLANITAGSMNADPATLARINAITAKAASSPLVSDTKKAELATSVLPALIAATTTALLPTTENINRVKAQTDSKLQIDALSTLMDSATDSTSIDDTTKQATADLIATLIAKRGTLDKATQAKLDALVKKAGTTTLLSPEQQSTIALQAAQAQAASKPAIAAKPSVGQKTQIATTPGIQTKAAAGFKAGKHGKFVKKQAKAPAAKRAVTGVSEAMKREFTNQLNNIKRKPVFSDKLDALKKTLDWAKTKTIPEQLQAEAYTTIKDMYVKRPVADVAAMEQFKNVLETLATSRLISDAQKTEVTETLIPEIATKPTTP